MARYRRGFGEESPDRYPPVEVTAPTNGYTALATMNPVSRVGPEGLVGGAPGGRTRRSRSESDRHRCLELEVAEAEVAERFRLNLLIALSGPSPKMTGSAER